MAYDIYLANSSNAINNGSSIVYADKLGNTKILTDHALNTPSIAEIQDKYDDRFDDIAYYTLGTNTLVGA